jgi:hypothetical protein
MIEFDVLNISGAIIPDKEHLDEFMRLRLQTPTECAAQWLDGVPAEARERLRSDISAVIALAGVECRRLLLAAQRGAA